VWPAGELSTVHLLPPCRPAQRRHSDGDALHLRQGVSKREGTPAACRTRRRHPCSVLSAIDPSCVFKSRRRLVFDGSLAGAALGDALVTRSAT